MPYRDEFTAGVQAFMNKYTIYLPGARGDGGMIDFDDPSFTASRAVNTPIVVAATAVKAAWKPGPRPGHLALMLRMSRDYKMLATGRREQVPGGGDRPLEGTYEAGKRALIDDATSSGATAATAKAYARDVLRRTGQKVDGSEWFDCYFLPWSRGRTTQMVLGAGAPYFFTATMNGCSFLVSGPAATPTVSHVNTTQPGDDLPGASPTKAAIKTRYATAVGNGTPNSALVTKYKAPATFQGNMHRYKEQPGEIGGIVDPDLVPIDPVHPHRADINTFLVGVLTGAGTWEFFYQRSAVLPTFVNVVRSEPFTYKPANPYQWARMKAGKEHQWKLVGGETTASRESQTINHRVTQCQRLNFP